MAQVRKWHRLSLVETDQLFSLLAAHPEYHSTDSDVFFCVGEDGQIFAVVEASIFTNFVKHLDA